MLPQATPLSVSFSPLFSPFPDPVLPPPSLHVRVQHNYRRKRPLRASYTWRSSAPLPLFTWPVIPVTIAILPLWLPVSPSHSAASVLGFFAAGASSAIFAATRIQCHPNLLQCTAWHTRGNIR